MNLCLRNNFVNLLILFLLPVYIFFHATILPLEISVQGISDAGYVSVITMAILGCTFLTLILLLFQTRLSRSLASTCAGAYVILIYLLREGSLHRLITSEHVTRGKFYTLQNVPEWQKVLAGTVLLLLLCCFIFMIVRHFRLVWTSLVKVEPWALALLLWFSVLVFSQLLDKSELNYTHFGRVLEECSECSASMFLFLSVQQIISTLKPWPDLQQPRD